MTRCARCDKVLPRKGASSSGAEPGGADGLVICSDCRCCEGCGARTGRGWSEDGVWCAACAPGGLEGRFCGICSRVFDNESEEAAMMIQCDTCLIWVHPLCDGLDEETYWKYAEGRPGFEKYECPDCSAEPSASGAVLWRQIERLVSRIQHKRIQYSAELLPRLGPERSSLTDPRRRSALQRWIGERAAAGAAWAVATLHEAGNPFGRVPPGPRPPSSNSNTDYVVTGTPADDCGECVYCRDKIKFGGPNVTKKPCLRRRVLKSSTGSSQTHSLALAAAEADPQPGSLPADGSQPQVVERLPRHAAARYRGSSAAFLLAIGCRRGGRWRRYQARGAWRPRQRAGAGRRCVGRHAGQWRRAARRAEDFVDDRQQRRQG